MRKRTSIEKLKSKTGVIVEGHRAVADLLVEEVLDLLNTPASLDQDAQDQLLDMVEEVFTEEDNARLEKELTDEEIKQSLERCNRISSPGSDAISYSVYHHC